MTEQVPAGPHERTVGPETEMEALRTSLMEAHERAASTFHLTLQVLTAQADDLDRLWAQVVDLGHELQDFEADTASEDRCRSLEAEIGRLRAAMTKALERARAFDDGSDGADGESAASVVAILSAALTPNASFSGAASAVSAGSAS